MHTPTKIVLLFARREGLNITNTAEMELLLTPEAAEYVYRGNEEEGPEERALQRVKTAITQWVDKTPEGREAWEASAGDLNIGDIASHQIDEDDSLVPFLINQGISVMRAGVMGADKSLDFDTVLVH